jgi:GNAT superfamily N-acetyltransferase
MPQIPLSHRLASPEDFAGLSELIDRAIAELQKPFLSEIQIAASRTIMGLDRQLIEDRTYFAVESGQSLVGCGGWSFRQTLYGGDNTPGRSARELHPETDPARIRAMYTHPSHTRKGIAKMILRLCEAAARNSGFQATELMATLAGEPLYRSQGYAPVERMENRLGAVSVPLIRMRKNLT